MIGETAKLDEFDATVDKFIELTKYFFYTKITKKDIREEDEERFFSTMRKLAVFNSELFKNMGFNNEQAAETIKAGLNMIDDAIKNA